MLILKCIPFQHSVSHVLIYLCANILKKLKMKPFFSNCLNKEMKDIKSKRMVKILIAL